MQKILQKNISDYSMVITNFEGPLDLLVYLITKNKMTIFDISLSELTDRYIEYLNAMTELDLEIASDFIVMAATLLDIKARKLVPELSESKEEEISEEELLSRIMEYKKYKGVSGLIGKMYTENFGSFEKAPEKIKYFDKVEYTGEKLSIEKINLIYIDILNRNEKKINEKAGEINKLTIHDKVTVKEKVRQIISYLKNNKSMIFNKIFNIQNSSNIEVIAAFLGILELSKIKEVSVDQEELFSDIIVKKGKQKTSKKIEEYE